MPALMRQKGARRELVLSSPTHSVIVSAAWLNLVKAPLRGREVALSSRGTWRSRLSRAGKQTKERLRRRLASICHREERGDLGCDLCHCLLRSAGHRQLNLSSRGTWRSRLSRAGKQTKDRLRRKKFCQRPLAGSRGCSVIARNEAISPFHSQQTDKREIAALRSQ